MVADDFEGWITNQDPDDLPDGAAVAQTNIACIRQGELVTRGGLRTIVFDES